MNKYVHLARLISKQLINANLEERTRSKTIGMLLKNLKYISFAGCLFNIVFFAVTMKVKIYVQKDNTDVKMNQTNQSA